MPGFNNDFDGLEGLCTSIPKHLSKIQNGRRTGRHLDFPVSDQTAVENTRKLTHLTPLYLYNMECYQYWSCT